MEDTDTNLSLPRCLSNLSKTVWVDTMSHRVGHRSDTTWLCTTYNKSYSGRLWAVHGNSKWTFVLLYQLLGNSFSIVKISIFYKLKKKQPKNIISKLALKPCQASVYASSVVCLFIIITLYLAFKAHTFGTT